MKRISENNFYRLTLIILLPILLSIMTGCAQDADGSRGGANDSARFDVPPIYVAQTLVLKQDGEPLVEKNYHQALKACRDASLSTMPLNEQDAKKLGRTYYQLWFDHKRSAWQKDDWDFEADGKEGEHCQFRIKHDSFKIVHTATENYDIDLMANSATVEASSGFVPGGQESPDDEDQLSTSEDVRGFQRLGYAQDAGQRCLRWRAPEPSSVESCTWSEGRKWGFGSGSGGGQATGAYDPSFIVLWVHPPNGSGGELTTQKMTVGGEPFEDAVFATPSGVSIKRADDDASASASAR